MANDYDLIIEPNKTIKKYWKELWQYRELFFFLAWKDILIRYKQTAIGIAWSIVRPLTAMLVFTVVFGRIAKLPSDGIPYPILVYSALLPWQVFANSLSDSSNSLISNSNMISKIYFPRIIIPASKIVVSLTDFAISFVLLLLLMVWYQFLPGWEIIFLPLFLVLALITALGAGLWLSALSVKYRDFIYIVPFILQFGLYISPVGFSSNIVPEQLRLLYSLNPMVGVIDGFRWVITGQGNQLYLEGFILSMLISLLIFFTGIMYFRKTERTFADII